MTKKKRPLMGRSPLETLGAVAALDAITDIVLAIATLLSDRSEAGTYAKVDGLMEEVESLRHQLAKTALTSPSPATGEPTP